MRKPGKWGLSHPVPAHSLLSPLTPPPPHSLPPSHNGATARVINEPSLEAVMRNKVGWRSRLTVEVTRRQPKFTARLSYDAPSETGERQQEVSYHHARLTELQQCSASLFVVKTAFDLGSSCPVSGHNEFILTLKMNVVCPCFPRASATALELNVISCYLAL